MLGHGKDWPTVDNMVNRNQRLVVDNMVNRNQRLVVFTSNQTKKASERIAY